jgi:hypothetical protein
VGPESLLRELRPVPTPFSSLIDNKDKRLASGREARSRQQAVNFARGTVGSKGEKRSKETVHSSPRILVFGALEPCVWIFSNKATCHSVYRVGKAFAEQDVLLLSVTQREEGKKEELRRESRQPGRIRARLSG